MAMPYQNRHYGLFSVIGSLYKKHNIPVTQRQKLGFILLAALDNYVEILIRNAYVEECDTFIEALKPDEMLDYLSAKYNSRFFNYSRNQILTQLIEDKFGIIKNKIEREVENERCQRSVQQLILHTNELERRGTLPDGN